LDPPTIPRRAQFVLLGVAVLLTGVQLAMAIAIPVSQPAWANYGGAAHGAVLAGIAALLLLPPWHRVRPWLWAGLIAAMAFSWLALIASFVHRA
jgi:membrane protein YdbS with pleckstrin-like domain